MLLHQIRKQEIEKYLIETTLQSLKSGTQSFFPNREETAGVRITQKQYIQYGNTQLLVKATCNGETDQYQTNIMFDGVVFTQPNDPESIKLGNIHVKPLSQGLNVKVLCTCPDFRWTFAWQDANANALIGNPPPPYNSSGQQPPRNPSKTPGMCKHLLRLTDDLEAEHFLV